MFAKTKNASLFAKAWNWVKNRINEQRNLAVLEAMPYSIKKDIGFKSL